jgi:hypothetical protein
VRVTSATLRYTERGKKIVQYLSTVMGEKDEQ